MDFIESNIMAHLPPHYKRAVEMLALNLSSSKAQTTKMKNKLLNDFFRKYTMIPEILLKENKNIDDTLNGNLDETDEVEDFDIFDKPQQMNRRRSIKHFYIEIEDYLWYDFSRTKPIFPCYFKLYRMPYFDTLSECFSTDILLTTLEYLKNTLKFPHSNLKAAMELFEECCTSPLNTEFLNHNNHLLLMYDKIIFAENDTILTWISALAENSCNDEEFCIQNIEWKLGKYPLNIELWKCYIEFLSSRNNLKVLDVYSRYCRIFIENADIRIQYINEIKKFNTFGINNIAKWFIDIIKIETEFNSFDAGFKMLIMALETIKISSKALFKFALRFAKKHNCNDMVTVATEKCRKRLRNKNNYFIQQSTDTDIRNIDENATVNDNFQIDFNENKNYKIDVSFKFTNKIYLTAAVQNDLEFPSIFISYLQSKSNFILLKKFIKTCKFFAIKQQFLLCWNFQLYIRTINSPLLNFIEDSLFIWSDHPFLKKIFTEKIWIGNTLKFNGGLNRHFISTLISNSKLYCCDIKYLTIRNQIFTMNEFTVLTSSKNIKTFEIGNVAVIKEDGSNISQEDVIERLPNAYKIVWSHHSNINHTTSETTYILAMLQRNVKLKQLTLYFSESFDPNYFSIFLKANAAPKGEWCIYIKGNENNDYTEFITKTLNETMSKWIPEDTKPDLYFQVY